MAEIAIVDEPERHRFAAYLDEHMAKLVYRVHGDRLTLIHTEVPDGLGGRGLGGQLVRAALNRARMENLTVEPWCEFARDWLNKHADEAATVDIDWDSYPPN